jgi:hypothetical protein
MSDMKQNKVLLLLILVGITKFPSILAMDDNKSNNSVELSEDVVSSLEYFRGLEASFGIPVSPEDVPLPDDSFVAENNNRSFDVSPEEELLENLPPVTLPAITLDLQSLQEKVEAFDALVSAPKAIDVVVSDGLAAEMTRVFESEKLAEVTVVEPVPALVETQQPKEEVRKVSTVSWGTFLMDRVVRGVGKNVLNELQSKKFNHNDINNFERVPAAFEKFKVNSDADSIMKMVEELALLEKFVVKATTVNDVRLYLKAQQISSEDVTQATMNCAMSKFWDEYNLRLGTILAVVGTELTALTNAKKAMQLSLRTTVEAGLEKSSAFKKARSTCTKLNASAKELSSGYDSDFENPKNGYSMNDFMGQRIQKTAAELMRLGERTESFDKITCQIEESCKALQQLSSDKKS